MFFQISNKNRTILHSLISLKSYYNVIIIKLIALYAIVYRSVVNFKGLVHPKNENSVINYSPSCHSTPVRPLFIFGTQIKIFLIKSDSSVKLIYTFKCPERY